jgi:hypothetical protein
MSNIAEAWNATACEALCLQSGQPCKIWAACEVSAVLLAQGRCRKPGADACLLQGTGSPPACRCWMRQCALLRGSCHRRYLNHNQLEGTLPAAWSSLVYLGYMCAAACRCHRLPLLLPLSLGSRQVRMRSTACTGPNYSPRCCHHQPAAACRITSSKGPCQLPGPPWLIRSCEAQRRG